MRWENDLDCIVRGVEFHVPFLRCCSSTKSLVVVFDEDGIEFLGSRRVINKCMILDNCFSPYSPFVGFKVVVLRVDSNITIGVVRLAIPASLQSLKGLLEGRVSFASQQIMLLFGCRLRLSAGRL